MAKFKYNPITHGLSGNFADLMIFIQRHGKTFLGKIPARSGKVSPDQEAIRVKFNQAAKYAKSCIKNPDTKALYAQKAGGGVTPFNLAFADFFTPPVVDNILTNGYTGVVGSRVEVQATDDTKVTGVHVSLSAANGTLIEEGAAVQDADTDQWVYTARVTNASLPGTKIVAVATDLPGNTTSAEKLL
jgi:hypothetical protein